MSDVDLSTKKKSAFNRRQTLTLREIKEVYHVRCRS